MKMNMLSMASPRAKYELIQELKARVELAKNAFDEAKSGTFDDVLWKSLLTTTLTGFAFAVEEAIQRWPDEARIQSPVPPPQSAKAPGAELAVNTGTHGGTRQIPVTQTAPPQVNVVETPVPKTRFLAFVTGTKPRDGKGAQLHRLGFEWRQAPTSAYMKEYSDPALAQKDRDAVSRIGGLEFNLKPVEEKEKTTA